MSNTNTNVLEREEVATVEELDTVVEALPETEEAQIEPTQKAPKKGRVWNRIFGLLIVALSAAVLFLKINFVVGTTPVEMTLLDAMKSLFADGANSLFGVIPALADTTRLIGQIAALSLAVFSLCLVLAALFGLITVISGKILRASVFFVSVAYFWYAFSIFVATPENTLDLICLAAAGVALLIYIVLAFMKNGAKTIVSGIQVLLTFCAFVVLGFTVAKNVVSFKAGLSSMGVEAYKTVFIAIAMVFALVLAFGYMRLQTKKGLGWDMFRYVLELILGGALCYVAIASEAKESLFLVCSIIVAAVALVQIIVCAIQIKCSRPKKVKVEEPVEEPVEEAIVEEFVREEYAEATPYEGGPVEGVVIAEEVNPTYVEPLPQVQTAGYDFYNTKSFDPFIAILDPTERNQFTELFILKYKGVMPEIPDYVVGGENKDFFRKLFIYLGQYRDRIPDGLLAKIYQFAIKM